MCFGLTGTENDFFREAVDGIDACNDNKQAWNEHNEPSFRKQFVEKIVLPYDEDGKDQYE